MGLHDPLQGYFYLTFTFYNGDFNISYAAMQFYCYVSVYRIPLKGNQARQSEISQRNINLLNEDV
jgi:hypothetical protein